MPTLDDIKAALAPIGRLPGGTVQPGYWQTVNNSVLAALMLWASPSQVSLGVPEASSEGVPGSPPPSLLAPAATLSNQEANVTDNTETQIAQITQNVTNVLGNAAPVAAIVGAVVPGLGALAAELGIAEQAVPVLGNLISLIYAMFHPNHLATLAAPAATPAPPPAA